MKTLTAPVTTQIGAEAAGFCEVYDIYLKEAITGPFGTTATLRITNLPGGLSFFTPKLAPEPSGTQGAAATYIFWPLVREMVKASSKDTNDKLALAASNVSGEWAEMLADVDWYDTPIIIRLVSTTISSPTADDCAVLFVGLVDSARISLEQIQLLCSNDLGALRGVLPSENMHQNCRFRFGDDQCTVLKLASENTKFKRVYAGSTTTKVVSNNTTSWTGTSVTFDTANDIVEKAGHSLLAGMRVRFYGASELVAGQWYYVLNLDVDRFRIAATRGGSAINLTTASGVTMDSESSLYEDSGNSASYGTDLVNPLADAAITASSEATGYTDEPVNIDVAFNAVSLASAQTHKLSNRDTVRFTATTLPSPLAAGVDYYVLPITEFGFAVSATPEGPIINITTSGSAVKITTPQFQANDVKSGSTGYWKMGDTADWGTLSGGYYLIPDAQAGLANAALKPYIQFDFGSAKQPKLWRISSVANLRSEELPRLIVFFSSTDAASWKHETYFEMPMKGGVLYDVLIPKAQSARYWRICVRSRWAESVFFTLLNKVYAYELSRHWWAGGRITFEADTPTTALRNISRAVLESYSGECIVEKLPAAPVSGDSYKIERGCPRTFNACCARLNWENFGGFLELPNLTVIR